jgi:hypothetical protein
MPLSGAIADAGHNAHVERRDKVWAPFVSFLEMNAARTA